MDASKKRRFRFGLRTLLIVTAISGIVAARYRVWKPQSDFQRVRIGMTKNEVLQILGQPVLIQRGDVILDSSGEQYMNALEGWKYPDGALCFSRNRCVTKRP